jgi:hypothetical protein
MFDSLKLFVPITAIFFGTLMPVAIVWLFLHFRAARNQLIYDTAVKLADKGQPVPPELFAVANQRISDLRRGIVLVMFGLALCATLFELNAPWTFGLVPTFMGIGYLIVWQIERRQAK